MTIMVVVSEPLIFWNENAIPNHQRTLHTHVSDWECSASSSTVKKTWKNVFWELVVENLRAVANSNDSNGNLNLEGPGYNNIIPKFRNHCSYLRWSEFQIWYHHTVKLMDYTVNSSCDRRWNRYRWQIMDLLSWMLMTSGVSWGRLFLAKDPEVEIFRGLSVWALGKLFSKTERAPRRSAIGICHSHS